MTRPRNGRLPHQGSIASASAPSGRLDVAADGSDAFTGLVDAAKSILDGHARSAVVLGDGFVLAAALPDGAVGLIVGDLPYDEKTHAGARTEHGGNDSPIDFGTCPPPEAFVPTFLRVARRWAIVFCAAEMLGDYKRAAGEAYIRGGVWVKSNAMPQKTGDRPAQWGEAIAFLHREGPKRWNGHGNPAQWIGPKDNDPTRRHPTKKPLWLMQALLRDFAEPGDIVFDPTCGEGTTGEAALSLGLRFIGCEIDPKYHAMAVERVARAERTGVQMHLPTRAPRPKQAGLFT